MRFKLLIGCLLSLFFIGQLQASPLEQGVTAFKSGNYTQALEYWQPLAKKNHPDALYNIGLLYMKGLGVEHNDRTAIKYFKQAASYGNIDAAYNLGVLYKRGRGGYPNSKDAIYWWKQAAERGHADSQFNYGVMLAYGNGTKKDSQAALKLWEQAAMQGHQGAIDTLVKTFEQGLFDIPADKELAKTWRILLK
ncbi:MAG: sel1 repeat family protein [Gammaproteobacteria bacterium]|nr:sel1 repeat family protein [Gammaproteobacteria bacterium]